MSETHTHTHMTHAHKIKSRECIMIGNGTQANVLPGVPRAQHAFKDSMIH